MVEIKIEILYDVEYGIFVVKMRGKQLSKTKFNHLEKQLKKVIDSFVK